MNPLEIINKYLKPGSLAFDILVEHGNRVTEKALSVARNLDMLKLDVELLREAAMLHDIGIVFVNAPKIGCFGKKPYVCHGYLGRELLEKEGYPLHALVCERHIGTGISLHDIEMRNLPLPRREMFPLSLEEKIICYADKFFSKKTGRLGKEKSLDEIRNELQIFGPDKLKLFEEMHKFFSNKSFQETDRLPAQ